MKLLISILIIAHIFYGQISFFNMPNPDMLPGVGYAYAEFDAYHSVKGRTDTINAYVGRMSYQATPYLELGLNLWFNPDAGVDPNRAVFATKWRVWLLEDEKLKISMSPGTWTSLYYNGSSVKNILYNFVGFTYYHSESIYTRFMIGGYSKFYSRFDAENYGMIGGFEQRLTKQWVFVTDYFQGSGEGFGLSPGLVFNALDDGSNLPIYLAYQFDNDSKDNNVIIFQIGYTFNMIGK
jgi:hypothetical protein